MDKHSRRSSSRSGNPHDPLAAAAPAPHTPAPHLTDEPSPTKDPKPSSPAPATTHEPSPATTDRPEPPTTTKSPQSTQPPSPPSPPKPVNPNPSTSQKAPTPHPSSDSPSSSHSGTSSSSNNSGTSLGTASANNTPQPTGSSNGLDDGSEVPTKVSDKVFVGLGAVGSLFLFSLGGVAFCRHRKKKNLAAALLRQTEQFNHNNPYAKISEAAAASNSNNINMSGKESLPMTPTKPIGTFSVVSDYTPAMPDEIEIYYGDSVTVLQEYDDGWCMGINNSRGGIKGVVPRHCLSGGKNNNNNNGGYDDGGHDGGQYGGGGDDGYYPPNPGFKAMANKRMSSMPAGGWNNGPPGGYQNGGGGHGGYGDYPPNPYNNQGPHLGTPNQGYYGGY
ncbi:hypothetical protein EC957_002184 [Mortierella hygrophila]|uniref:SH3 domain-containing protein n=1 Tax=Mortierella hygrophila TaxID=979708 RepID=A0A9P6F4M5_9FUNG|nr:hypothetical protein EC957_002184 [Mortierella hygrophila]